MGKIAGWLKGFFYRNSKEHVESLLSRINSSMGMLLEKSENFNSSMSDCKAQIEEIAGEAAKFTESDEIFAAKLEQQILSSITVASSACDSVLAGADPIVAKKAVAKLEQTVHQRTELYVKRA